MSDTKESPKTSVEKELEAAVTMQESTPHEIYRPDIDISGIDDKKLLRKLDIALIPWLAILYLLSFLDRTSIGNAKLYHLTTDIGITDKQYLLCLTIFFFR
jgi:predicted transcriptional regulator